MLIAVDFGIYVQTYEEHDNTMYLRIIGAISTSQAMLREAIIYKPVHMIPTYSPKLGTNVDACGSYYVDPSHYTVSQDQ